MPYQVLIQTVVMLFDAVSTHSVVVSFPSLQAAEEAIAQLPGGVEFSPPPPLRARSSSSTRAIRLYAPIR